MTGMETVLNHVMKVVNGHVSMVRQVHSRKMNGVIVRHVKEPPSMV